VHKVEVSRLVTVVLCHAASLLLLHLLGFAALELFPMSLVEHIHYDHVWFLSLSNRFLSLLMIVCLVVGPLTIMLEREPHLQGNLPEIRFLSRPTTTLVLLPLFLTVRFLSLNNLVPSLFRILTLSLLVVRDHDEEVAVTLKVVVMMEMVMMVQVADVVEEEGAVAEVEMMVMEDRILLSPLRSTHLIPRWNRSLSTLLFFDGSPVPLTSCCNSRLAHCFVASLRRTVPTIRVSRMWLCDSSSGASSSSHASPLTVVRTADASIGAR
jgi:hypothetical protein